MGTESIYKIYAESFKDQGHLDAIVSEAQEIVNDALKASASAKGVTQGAPLKEDGSVSNTRSSGASVRRFMIPMSEEPDVRSQRAVALLSNGSYHVMITNACGGYSTWRDLDVTRWREDTTRDSWGQLCYVRDLGEKSAWTIGRQPLSESDESAFEFHPDRAEFREQHGDLEVQGAVCVVHDADAEVRVLTLINHGDHEREIELTSYAEVCLNDRRADQSHPAFAKLFLETEFDPPAVRFWPAAGREA